MLKNTFFLIFLIFNNIDLQYVPMLRRVNNTLIFIRMYLLRFVGASIRKNLILKLKTTIFDPKNLIIGNKSIIG